MNALNFINRKGGVGKTAFTVNIAFELAKAGYLTLVIDLDSQCDITEFFYAYSATSSNDPIFNIRNVLENDCTIEEACIEIADNLYLIPGSPDLDDFDFKYSQYALRDKLQSEGLRDVDFVLFDNPPHINEAVRCGLVASDHSIIISEAESPAMNNLVKIYNQLCLIQEKLNPNLNILGIALNKIDMRRNITSRNVQYIYREYGDTVFHTSISIDSAIPNSYEQKKPIRELKWRSRTVSQFQRLLKEILIRIDETEDVQ